MLLAMETITPRKKNGVYYTNMMTCLKIAKVKKVH